MVAADESVTDKATALADVFSNCSLATATSGSTDNGRSTAQLDISCYENCRINYRYS
jgi:hypothetical protein